MAGLVGLAREKKDIGSEQLTLVDIVDGQQRLTTLILILRALANTLPESDEDRRDLERLLVKRDKTHLVLLQTNHDKSNVFVDYLRHGKIPQQAADLLAEQKLVAAIHDCEEFVQTWPDTTAKPLQELYITLKHRLTMIFHQIEDEKVVYTVFEVLNSRGLDVAWLDKFKSSLMGKAFELEETLDSRRGTIDELHRRWGSIYGAIGSNQTLLRDALRFLGTLESREPLKHFLKEEGAAANLVLKYGRSLIELVKCSKLLDDALCAEKKFLGYWEAAGALEQGHARLVGTAIIMRGFEESVELDLVTCLSRTTFGVYSLISQDARKGVGEYVRLSWDIHNSKLNAKQIKARLKAMKAVVTEHRIRRALKNSDRYGSWSKELRYLLYEYEKHLCEEAGEKLKRNQWDRIFAEDPANSIEHILPQSRAHQRSESANVYVHRLGNLTLLTPTLNSSLQDKLPKDKKTAYAESGLRINSEVARSLEEGRWNKAAVEERERKIVDWAAKLWAA